MTFTFCSFSTSQMTDTTCVAWCTAHIWTCENQPVTRPATAGFWPDTEVTLQLYDFTWLRSQKKNDCRPLIQASVTSSDKNQSTWVECLKIELKDVFPAWICPRGATNLFHYAVERFWAADVETDEHSIGVGIGQGPHVVIVWRS